MDQSNPRPGARHRASVSFSSLARATAGLPADFRCHIFGSLPETLQDGAWRALGAWCDRENQAANRAAGESSWRGAA